MTQEKVDLTLLKRLVSELETALNAVEQIQADASPNQTELVVEAAKASGLAAGVMQEAGMLVMDIYKLMEIAGNPTSKNEFLEKLLDSFKVPGSTN
jgi:hypothetical protein